MTDHRLYATADKNVVLQLLAQLFLGFVKRFLHHKLLRVSLLDLAARPPFLRLHLGPLDHLDAHLHLRLLNHLEALRRSGTLDCLEDLLHWGALDHLEALQHLEDLDHLEALQHLEDLDCLEVRLHLGDLDCLEALLHLVALQSLRLLSQSHLHVDTLSDAVNSQLVQISLLSCHTCKVYAYAVT